VRGAGVIIIRWLDLLDFREINVSEREEGREGRVLEPTALNHQHVGVPP
jgi:hypothetical protein